MELIQLYKTEDGSESDYKKLKREKEEMELQVLMMERIFPNLKIKKTPYRECGYCNKNTVTPVPNENFNAYFFAKDPRRYEKENQELFKKPKKFKRCSRCKSTYYCNAKCQKNHWKTHKKKCKKV